MAKPIVAVVGRPNVGKSTLVNRITQKPRAIVHEIEGVTRDRTFHDAEWNGFEFTLCDTGGIEVGNSEDVFQTKIREQAITAIEEADAIIFMTDSKTGVTEEDEVVARILKRSQKPVFLVVNKCDTVKHESSAYDFYSLGLGEPFPISAAHGNGTGDLLDRIVEILPRFDEIEKEAEQAEELKVAIIGRPNAGKSSLLNKLCGTERSIVSDVAGTTRDTVDTLVEYEGKYYRLVDTAGMRKRSVVHDNLEYYSYVRAERSLERADVALVVIDATLGVTDQDQRVAGMAEEAGCGIIILLNKWDLVTDPERREEITQDLQTKLQFVSYAPVIRISALTGRSIGRIWDALDDVAASCATEISTARLNKLLTELREFGHTVTKGKKQLKMNYVTQTGVKPPIFTIFVNAPELVTDNFRHYIENRFRNEFEFVGAPIRFKFKKKA
ncbi:MAG: ribosome biogenesis GTPase Der [Coriobacteriales bacterium]|nr:ribosome biogenesis GTPase Der [Coriobacteriales bacterium]